MQEIETSEEKALRLAIIRSKCEGDHLFFTRYFFKKRQDSKFVVNWHHHVLANTIEKVINGEILNVVINVPPGSSKTEEVVINLIARGLAINPYAKFLHLSYSSTLTSLNSQAARDIVMSDTFQELWPTRISQDDAAKARWNIEINGNKAGGCYAIALGGQVTGFRAGRMVPNFQGAILIDDPLKPTDAFSEVKRNEANRTLISTVKSRKANPSTPIIIIMQRLAENDPTGFVKAGNLDDMGSWEFISIPALITEEYIKENRRFITPQIEALIDKSEKDKDGRFSYWPYKEPLNTLLQMEKGGSVDLVGAKVSRIVFAGQYMQSPQALGGNIIRGEWFVRYDEKQIPILKSRYVFADTAQKTKEHNDYSVFQCWGEGDNGKIYLLDQIRGKWEAPELKRRAIAFWRKHKELPHETMKIGNLRKMYVEDKVSGTGLIQEIKAGGDIPIEAIQRNTDKLTRVMDALPYLESEKVCIPLDAPFTSDLVVECEGFNADGTHAHDDQLDPMVDAIDKMLSNKNKLRHWENLI